MRFQALIGSLTRGGGEDEGIGLDKFQALIGSLTPIFLYLNLQHLL